MSINVGDTVKFNAGVRNLHVQLRQRYRPGTVGKVVALDGRTHLEVAVEEKGTVKVARIWVDEVNEVDEAEGD
jgi:hypothetical protein